MGSATQRAHQVAIPIKAESERGTTVNRPDISLLNDDGEILSSIEVAVGHLSAKADALSKPVLVIRAAALEPLPGMASGWPGQVKLQWLIEGAVLRGASERGHFALNKDCPVCAVCKKDVSRDILEGSYYRCPICAAHCDPSDDNHLCAPRYLSHRCGICKEQVGATFGLAMHMAFVHGVTADCSYNDVNPSYLWRKVGEGDRSTSLRRWGQTIPVRLTLNEWLDWDNCQSNPSQNPKW